MKGLKLSDEKIERCIDIITRSIHDFVDKSGTKGAVFGLSGGIDSALVGKLAKRALGERLETLILPEIGVTNEKDVKDAVSFAEETGIQYKIIEINKVTESIKNSLLKISDQELGVHAKGNLAPRVRMIFIYAVSNMKNLIVLGTGNKTEIMLGYFTKYGDGGVDILPLGDLYKTQVRQLACHLKIPSCIIDKTPSAGLYNGQTDEKELGESYEIIDKALFLMEKGYSKGDISSGLNLDTQKVQRLIDRVRANSHKRFMPPVIEQGFKD